MRIDTPVIVIAFVFLIYLAISPADAYLPMMVAGLVFASAWKSGGRSFFTDDIPEGTVTADDTRLGDLTAVSSDLDSSNDLDALLARDAAVTDGDDLLHAASVAQADKSRQAVLARCRFTSDNFRGLYQEELHAGEHRDWWENDALSAQTVRDGVQWE